MSVLLPARCSSACVLRVSAARPGRPRGALQLVSFHGASRAASDNNQGAVLGANQSLSALARALAPTIGGLLFTHWFMGGALLTGGVLMLVALVVSVPAVSRIQPRAA